MCEEITNYMVRVKTSGALNPGLRKTEITDRCGQLFNPTLNMRRFPSLIWCSPGSVSAVIGFKIYQIKLFHRHSSDKVKSSTGVCMMHLKTPTRNKTQS